MPVFRRELAFRTQDPSSLGTGEWWHLVLDTDAPAFYVEHTWDRPNTHAPKERLTGADRFGINDFLTFAQDQPAHSALLSALREMFREVEKAP
jgi:hypothetical protein